MRKSALILLMFIILPGGLLMAGCDAVKGIFSGSGENAEVESAYQEYRAAMLTGDVAALKAHIAQQKQAEFDGPQAEQMLALARSLYPQNITVSGVSVQGNAATLTATGPMEGGTAEGTVHLVKEEGGWKVFDENWHIKIEAATAPASSPPPVPDNTRPYEYEKAVGIWSGHEAGGTGTHWTFTLAADYEISVQGPGGQHYSGTAVADWDKGQEGGNLRVLPGGAVFDVRVRDSSTPEHAGRLSLGSFKLMGTTLQICGSEPGLMRRASDFASSGGIRCFELTKTQDLPAAPAAAVQPSSSAAPSLPVAGGSSFSKGDAGVSGEAIVVKDGVTETYPLVTGFFSDTRFANPAHATIQFQAPAPEHSNARRIEITLDATKTGTHYADGKLLSESFMGESKVRIGEYSSQGYAASFRWVADGGQIFWPKTSCTFTITSPYTGAASGEFSGELNGCPVHSAGIDYTISSVRFTMRGAPKR